MQLCRESKLLIGALHSSEIGSVIFKNKQPQKNKEVPRTQYVDPLCDPSRSELPRMPGGENKGESHAWALGLRQIFCFSSAPSPPVGHLHFPVVLDDLRSPAKALGCGQDIHAPGIMCDRCVWPRVTALSKGSLETEGRRGLPPPPSRFCRFIYLFFNPLDELTSCPFPSAECPPRS